VHCLDPSGVLICFVRDKSHSFSPPLSVEIKVLVQLVWINAFRSKKVCDLVEVIFQEYQQSMHQQFKHCGSLWAAFWHW
jgi:hypothetical protein